MENTWPWKIHGYGKFISNFFIDLAVIQLPILNLLISLSSSKAILLDNKVSDLENIF